MTTAHRPTWHAAVGGSSQDQGYGAQGGGIASGMMAVRDMPQHKKLKLRQVGQITELDSKEQFKEALEERVDQEKRGPRGGKIPGAGADDIGGRGGPSLLLKSADDLDGATLKKYDDADDDDSESDLDSDSDSDDDDSGDDEEALQLELEKIKKEREALAVAKKAEAAADAKLAATASALQGNALLLAEGGGIGGAAAAAGAGGDSKVKRKWNDDVVFKGQARGEPQQKKRFINDAIRNDFHKRFLNKYIT